MYLVRRLIGVIADEVYGFMTMVIALQINNNSILFSIKMI